MTKFIRVRVTSEFFTQLCVSGIRPAVRVVDGIPKDAHLIHIHHDDIMRVWDLFFTHEHVGDELIEGDWLLSLPIRNITYMMVPSS